MYLKHFGLTETPFSITPDTSFYFASHSYQEGLNTLLFAILSGEGFIKITGEVGTGKTLLCRKLMSSLDASFKVAYVPNPYLEPHSLLMTLAQELGITVATDVTQHALLTALTHGLLDFARNDIKVVVCLDEVQAMPIETLEALRLLSNLETEKRKLLQVVIFGQPELEVKLNHASIRQLKQRITFEYQLDRLSHDEMQYYLNHRLIIAGYQGSRIFSSAALTLLYFKSKGVPRLVNILAHKSLLAAYGKGKHQVGFSDVFAAITDTRSIESTWRKLRLNSFTLSVFLSVCGSAFLAFPK
ncbi:ExeA family protein [Methylotenera sp.]|uniref:ExeA family protein n=1 Tax=Methylotenera sp. TaxID=2051956 RepID=UPI00271F70C8|nr:AAA family ATPase [Methylotenera sp.]MDO9204610.1 AAA family ATPase [Methylotenera sp.]MDO9392383.1 AAA family ATPase [Methylotenera sp.]MDP1524066.1 AAA family ATPase [Methylotenera sp.]MDP2071260.1 AAA family ATPase [Methylotenera sp.]MDP2231559.1 AAA family ATPase [Methylotenera sp.]